MMVELPKLATSMKISVVLFCVATQTFASHEDAIECGIRNEPGKTKAGRADARAAMRPIVNGELSTKNEFPWMISLKVSSR